jgi:hypothetical protein
MHAKVGHEAFIQLKRVFISNRRDTGKGLEIESGRPYTA